MFGKANPCTSTNDLAQFRDWWETATGLTFSEHDGKVRTLRKEVEDATSRIQEARLIQVTLSAPLRTELGKVQEGLVPKRAQLLDLERAHPYVQPEMILAIPGVHGFWLNGKSLFLQTQCLYGRDYRDPKSPWCRIGRLHIRIEPVPTEIMVKMLWTNLDGNRAVMETAQPVPAPQVDDNGGRNCIGNEARSRIADGLTNGRVDSAIAAIIRYTEHHNPSTVSGRGMGRFSPVTDTQVPFFYLQAFPR